jgi:MFS family permease
MVSNTTPQRKRRVFYGYYLLAVTFLFLVLFNGSGVFVFSLFVRPLEAALGWGRGEVMAGFTVFYATLGVASPVVGRLVDRYGARLVIPAGALVMGLGFMLVSHVSSLPLFYAGYAIVGAGAAGTGPVPCSAIITNWFKRRRGLALGLMAAGIGAGGPVMAPFIGYMLSHYDWRTSYLSLGVVLIVVIVPVALAMVRTRPSEMGLYPDGDSTPVEEPSNPGHAVKETTSFTLKQAARTRAFWFISIASVFYAFGSMGAIQASVPFLEDIGYPTAMAAGAIGATGFGSAVGKILFGRLCDKMRPHHVFAIGSGVLVVGALVLLSVRPDSPLLFIWTYALLLGLGAGAWLPTLSTLASSRFGLLHYGAVFGAIHLWLSLGTAVGPLFSGVMYDAIGSYHMAFTIFAVLLLLAIPMILLVGKPTAPRGT